ncbi:hypothetical protein PMZ80_009468 [Knufia obscura]|uniref:Uncharacterized protein n=2 Tax=Knufia TaxID=430999 RepID=A0AAN8I2Y4_9EURO|nr:hypothetical protein PMZ80_009468 [Knufia obscura]KAK5949594.1 hypothetical protein OHC33_009401 [Knufia fluminis]
MDDKDTKPSSKSPSGSSPHNSYGLVQDDKKTESSQTPSQKPKESMSQEENATKSQSPSGAEPHNSYGILPGEKESGNRRSKI